VVKSGVLKQALERCPVLVWLRSIKNGSDINLIWHSAAFDILRVPLGVNFVHKPRVDEALEGGLDLLI
jgi:hypothetical protein